jgi:glycosyltransferase involved in cell wall biosynthesis
LKKNRVRIITLDTYPKGMANTYRINCYAKSLILANHDVDVVSPISHSKCKGAVFNYKNHIDDIPYTIVWNIRKPKFKLLAYIIAELKSYWLLIHSIRTSRQFDVLWIFPLGFIPNLILVTWLRLIGKKVILELNEYPYSTEGNAYTRIPWVKRILLNGTLKLIFPKFHGIVVISENLDIVVSQVSRRIKTLKVPILLDNSKGNSDEKRIMDRPLKHQYVFHAGSLSEQKDGIISFVKAYIQAAVKLRNEGIKFYLVLTNNSSHVWNKIENLIIVSGLSDQLIITGFLDEVDLLKWMRHSDVLVINKPYSFQNIYNFPTKLGDYLLSGRPVIVAAEGLELNKYLSTHTDCILVKPNDTKALSDAIIELVKNPKLAEKIGKMGKELAKNNFDFTVHVQRISGFISSL